MVTDDHARELAEDMHAYEDAVAAATDKVALAEMDVITFAKRLYHATGEGCDDALRGLQLMVHRLETAENDYDAAINDRDIMR